MGLGGLTSGETNFGLKGLLAVDGDVLDYSMRPWGIVEMEIVSGGGFDLDVTKSQEPV